MPTRSLERRNQRLLLVGVACYALLVATLMAQGGLAITPDVVAVAVGLVVLLLLVRGRLVLSDWLPRPRRWPTERGPGAESVR